MGKFKIGDLVTNTNHWMLVPQVVGVVTEVYDEYMVVSIEDGEISYELFSDWRKLTKLEKALK